jgi:hypothetical protein
MKNSTETTQAMNTEWTCLTPNKESDPKEEFGTTPNKPGTPGEDERYEELLLILSARRSDLEAGPPWTAKALKERIAKREAREMAYHKISRWLKRLATEDPTILFPPADQIRPKGAGK